LSSASKPSLGSPGLCGVVLVNLHLAGVDDRVGLVGAVLRVLVAGREGLDVCEGFLVGEGAGIAEAATVEDNVGDDAL